MSTKVVSRETYSVARMKLLSCLEELYQTNKNVTNLRQLIIECLTCLELRRLLELTPYLWARIQEMLSLVFIAWYFQRLQTWWILVDFVEFLDQAPRQTILEANQEPE
jgi:hypothetical protein